MSTSTREEGEADETRTEVKPLRICYHKALSDQICWCRMYRESRITKYEKICPGCGHLWAYHEERYFWCQII